MFRLEVDGELWHYAFVQPDGCLSGEDREHLLSESVRAYRNGEKRRNIRGKEFEGMVVSGEFYTLGACSGRLYEAEFETPKGKRKASIIFAEPIDPSFN